MSDVVFFSTWHLLRNQVPKTRFLTQKNLKKFEVSCIGRNTQKQIQEKNINPNPKDSDQRERKTQAVATQADPSRDDPSVWALGLGCAWLGASAALGDQACEPQAAATQASEPQAWVARSGLKPVTSISDLDLLSLSVFGFFFFSCVLLWCSGGFSLICSYL